MNLRILQEEREQKMLSPFAAKSQDIKGRVWKEEQCDLRTDFQRDRDRIIHCKSFRRLKHKTQVFISPEGDHYRTRLTHTLEVAQIARTISRALCLNEDLTEAIALAHDLGHTPFGHAGEEILNAICPLGFQHYEQSIRVVEILENDGKGLNLTWEVKNGIANHPTKGDPKTLEGKVVQISDKIAYINHDIDDAIRGGILEESQLPKDCIEVLGSTSSKRINRMIRDIIQHSIDQSDIFLSDSVKEAMMNLRQFMFQQVYVGSKAKEQEKKAQNIVQQLYTYFVEHPMMLRGEFQQMLEQDKEPLERIVCDYIAGMTDRYAVNQFCKLYLPMAWNIY